MVGGLHSTIELAHLIVFGSPGKSDILLPLEWISGELLHWSGSISCSSPTIPVCFLTFRSFCSSWETARELSISHGVRQNLFSLSGYSSCSVVHVRPDASHKALEENFWAEKEERKPSWVTPRPPFGFYSTRKRATAPFAKRSRGFPFSGKEETEEEAGVFSRELCFSTAARVNGV